jgi:NO-binding membrane sensor protein with MHYT domain
MNHEQIRRDIKGHKTTAKLLIYAITVVHFTCMFSSQHKYHHISHPRACFEGKEYK